MKYIRIYNAFNRQLLTYQRVFDFPNVGRRPCLTMEITSWSFACPFDSCPFTSAFHPPLTCVNCHSCINTPLSYEP